jgi:hypothetical protein
MGALIVVIIVIVLIVAIMSGVNGAKKQKADLTAMPAGSHPLGYGFYRTQTGEIWRNREPVTGVRAEVNTTQRYSLTRVATVVGAATKKTDGTLVISYKDAAGAVQVITKQVKGAADYRTAMNFAAKLNGIAGQL